MLSPAPNKADLIHNVTVAGLVSTVLASFALVCTIVKATSQQPQQADRSQLSRNVEPLAETGLSLFRDHVRAILTRKCLRCHQPGRRDGGLDLSRRSAALAGGDSREAVVPGKPAQSLLYQLVTAGEMPPGMNLLSPAEIAALRKWIELGAPYEEEPLTAAEETVAQAWPGEWPQWRGSYRDGVSRESGLLKGWPKQGPPVLWKVASGPGYSGLTVSRGRLYTLLQDGDKEAVVCWNADTGEELWRFRYPAKFVSDQGSGPRSTPTVDGNRVYTVGATGILHCLNAVTGALVWKHDLIRELYGRVPGWGVSFSPLVDGDLVFTQPGGPWGNSLAAFDKHTGALRWKTLDDRPGYSSPVLITAAGVRQLLFFTAEALVSVAPETGQLYWRYPWLTDMDCNIATPIAVGNDIFISSGYGHGCALLKVIYFGPGKLEVRRVYENKKMRNHFSSSILYQGHLYGFDEARLVCMEPQTGQMLWQAKGFRKGSLLAADGHLIILGENGKLALAEATPTEYREKASFRVSENRCWTVPTLAGGKLYVRDEEQIVCLDLRAAKDERAKAEKDERSQP